MLLPNDTLRAYPQPEAKTDVISGKTTPIPDTYGSTYRVAVPGTPAVERTPEEQAADTAAGREWRNEATLSGGRMQLYGKRLDGWIYVDPAGARWLVRCAQLDENVLYSTAEPLELTVTLSRFGELGGAPESYQYATTISDWGIDGPGAVPSTARLLVDDVRADGGAAVVMAHQRTFNSGAVQDVRRAYSFLELVISGAGAAAVVSIAVVRSRSQVVRIDTTPPAPQTHLAGWHKLEVSEGGSGEWEWVTYAGGFGEGSNPVVPSTNRESGGVTVEYWELLEAEVASGTAATSCRRIVAMWYASAGTLADVTLRYTGTYGINWPMPAGGARDATLSLDWEVTVEVAGAAGATIVGSENNSTHSEFPAGSREVAVVDRTFAAVADGGESGSTDSGNGPYGRWDEPGSATLDSFALSADALVDRVYEEGFAGLVVSDGLSLVRYANHVIGIRVSRPQAPSFVYAFHPPTTPSGPAAGAVYVPSSSAFDGRYGSWCPYTLQAQWHATAPICYV